MQTASGYVRLSAAADLRNLSLEGMQRDITRRADELGVHLEHMRVDNGISGDVRDRPAFTQWLSDDVDVLIAYHVDRMTREGLNVAALILDRVEGKQFGRPVRLVDCAGMDSKDGDAFRFGFVIKAEVARSERERMRARMRAMHARAKEADRWVAGPPPYGWINQGGTLIPHPAQQPVLAEVARQLLYDNRSFARVARWLNEHGHLTRRGGTWSATTVRKMLYSGAAERNWPASTLLALRELSTTRPVTPGRKPSRLLSSLIECCNCGTRLVVNRDRYACGAKGHGKPCPQSVTIKCVEAEQYVTDRFLAAYGSIPFVEHVTVVAHVPEIEQASKDKLDALAALKSRPTQDDFDKLQQANHVLDTFATPIAQETVVSDHTTGEEWARRDTDGRRAMLRDWIDQLILFPASDPDRIEVISTGDSSI